MASQMFWLLSYVSLGLALTLGNRPPSIHSSQQQQQQQQQQQKQQQSTSSSSSSQTQKSRQDHRFSRDPTIVDVGNGFGQASAPEEELDNVHSYRYDEEPAAELDDDFTKDWLERADRSWRDPSVILRRRELLDDRRDKSIINNNNNNNKNNNNINNNNNHNGEVEVREASSSRENAFLDEFATAVMETLYPRHRDLLVPAKSPNIISQSWETRRYEIDDNEPPPIGYPEALRQLRMGKKLSRISSGQRDYAKKITRSPVIVYRTDQPDEEEEDYEAAPPPPPPMGIGANLFDIDDKRDERIFLQRSHGGLSNDNGRRSFDGWSTGPIDNSKRNSNAMKNREYGYESVDGSGSTSSNSKPPGKRNQGGGGGGGGGRGRSSNPRGWTPAGQQSPAAASNAGASIASQFLLRSARGNRQYDVPQIECPASEDGMERFACPTPDRMGRYRCIDDHVLCDGFIDCPTAEDEDRQACMFYKTTKAHLDVLADALLRWARGR